MKITRNQAGDYEFRDGDRLRAIARYRRSSARPWHVHRVTERRDGSLDERGADTFRSFAEVKTFLSENPAVWGRR